MTGTLIALRKRGDNRLASNDEPPGFAGANNLHWQALAFVDPVDREILAGPFSHIDGVPPQRRPIGNIGILSLNSIMRRSEPKGHYGGKNGKGAEGFHTLDVITKPGAEFQGQCGELCKDMYQTENCGMGVASP